MTGDQKSIKAEFARAIALEKGVAIPDGWEVIDYDIPKQGDSYAMTEREKTGLEESWKAMTRE